MALTSRSTTSPQEFAAEYIAAEDMAWGRGETAALKELELPSVVYHISGIGEVKGWEAHERMILGFRMKNGFQQEWRYLTGEGNHVVLGYVSRWTVSEQAPERPQQTTMDYIFVLRLEKGLVAEAWLNGSTTTVSALPGK